MATTVQMHAPAFVLPEAAAAARQAAPLLWRFSVAFALLFAALYGLTFIDPRLFAGVSVWEKPAKFALSLGLQMATVAWALSHAPVELQRSGKIRVATWLILVSVLFEMLYIGGQAARGEASHFNTGTPLTATLYILMGLGAVTLTAGSGFVGALILRARTDFMGVAAGSGLILGAVLGTLVGGFLSSGSGHWIGGDMTDATGLPFFHWSTSGGDLRVAHFIGLHAAQALPLAALSGRGWAVMATGLGISLATLATFLQALAGMPLLQG